MKKRSVERYRLTVRSSAGGSKRAVLAQAAWRRYRAGL